MSRLSSAAAVASLAALLAEGVPAEPLVEPVPVYEAQYEVRYKGRRIGESVQRVTRQDTTGDDPAPTYRFEATTSAKGLARLLRRQPIVEESTFELRGEAVRPLMFSLDDGTRKGDDDVSVEFDWDAGTARVETSSGVADLSIEPGVHDRATLQVALMLELAADIAPEQHRLIDDDSAKTYTYEVGAAETLDTPAGEYEAIEVIQRREGSSRHTHIWMAPALRHLPVKIEQRRDDETLTTLTLLSVDGRFAEARSDERESRENDD